MTNKGDFTQRNVAIDILRALTMLLMVFVNDFWSVKGVPQWMLHGKANEDFLGLSDVVFPVFLFVVGMSIPFAIERRFSKGFPELDTLMHILSRTFALLIMGVFTVNTEAGILRELGMSMPVFKVLMVAAFFMIWNVYPKTDKPVRHLFTVSKVVGVLILIYLAVVFKDAKGGIFQARWWGILGIIGWTYFVCATVYLFVRDNITKVFFFWLGFIVLCMVKSSELIPKGSFFNALTGILHLESGASAALTMGGILFSLVVTKYSHVTVRKKVIFLVSTVAALLIAAAITNQFWIISKIKATPPWVLYSCAVATGVYGLLQWLVSAGKASWFNIIKPAGTATLTCYIIPHILYSIFFGFLSFSLPDWMKEGVFGLIKCACFSFLCIGVTALFEKLNVKLKV